MSFSCSFCGEKQVILVCSNMRVSNWWQKLLHFCNYIISGLYSQLATFKIRSDLKDIKVAYWQNKLSSVCDWYKTSSKKLGCFFYTKKVYGLVSPCTAWYHTRHHKYIKISLNHKWITPEIVLNDRNKLCSEIYIYIYIYFSLLCWWYSTIYLNKTRWNF